MSDQPGGGGPSRKPNTEPGDTVDQRSQETEPEHVDVLAPDRHDEQTAAEAAEQADPGVTGADHGA